MELIRGRCVTGINACRYITGRRVLKLLQTPSYVLQTALKLLNILPRHRGIGYCSLALVLALNVTAYSMSVHTVRRDLKQIYETDCGSKSKVSPRYTCSFSPDTNHTLSLLEDGAFDGRGVASHLRSQLRSLVACE